MWGIEYLNDWSEKCFNSLNYICLWRFELPNSFTHILLNFKTIETLSNNKHKTLQIICIEYVYIDLWDYLKKNYQTSLYSFTIFP